ncbi:tyrosine-type recombinase/integrase [Candidatus Dependentiae bacterium]|nr:tyrosine-type recombinase/integrase [Candidatus Dependentiae bacterium]
MKNREFTKEQMERIMDQPDLRTRTGLRDKAIMELAAVSGLDFPEITDLRLSQIHLDKGFIRYKLRIIPLSEYAEDILYFYLNSMPLFWNDDAEVLSSSKFTQNIEGYVKSAGFKKKRVPEFLLRLFENLLRKTGLNRDDIPIILGKEVIS